jgi:3-oxoacyl-[acyl-carrier-protein] synthase III
MPRSIITGTGCYIPADIKTNRGFESGEFYDEHQKRIEQALDVVIEKFRQITGIEERRYAPDAFTASDMAAFAARQAIEESGIDAESIDQIIVAHNYGDVKKNSTQSDMVPSIASRVKHLLGVRNPACVPYDILFGCPGWLQALIQADTFIKAGAAKRCLVIGTETLSRVIDPFDRDSMLFSDGAGACILEYKPVEEGGIIGSLTRSDSIDEAFYINFGESYSPSVSTDTRFIKMRGRKVYEYATRYVPEAMKECLEKCNVSIHLLKKIFIHQANEKMDETIIKAFYKLYGIPEAPKDIMPMNIRWLGNSSVATIPILFDTVRKGGIAPHVLYPDDIIMFASVGAGMNINAICYQCK